MVERGQKSGLEKYEYEKPIYIYLVDTGKWSLVFVTISLLSGVTSTTLLYVGPSISRNRFVVPLFIGNHGVSLSIVMSETLYISL